MKISGTMPLFSKVGNLIILLSSLFLFSTLTWQCKCNKKGKVIVYGPVKAPVAISFIDANRLLNIQIPEVKVTLVDDRREVVTPNGLSFSSLIIKGGSISLALKDSAVFNNDRPYRFAIKAEAAGYSTTFLSVVVREDKAQYIPVFMTKVDDPPAGMSGFLGSIPVSNSTIGSKVIITPKVSNNQRRKVSVSFDSGTVLLSDREPLRGDVKSVTYNFSYASSRSLAALRTFPGGGLVTDAVDSIGNVIATPGNPFMFTSAGWMTLEINSGSQNVTGFSKPVELRMPIDDSLINPVSLKGYKEGDRIDIWSLSDRCVWKKEDVAFVKKSDDGLIAVMRIRHLTPWNLDFKTNMCGQITFSYNNARGAFTSYCEIVSFQNGLPFNGAWGTHSIAFSAVSGSFDVINGPQNTRAVCLVYDNTAGPGGILASSDFTFCNTPPALNIPSGSLNSVILDVVVRDAMNQYPVCNNAVFFKPDLSPNPFGYGDNLVVAGNVGTGTLYQVATFGATNIQLFYIGLNGGGGTIDQTVTFVVNLADTSGGEEQVNLFIGGVDTGLKVKCQFITGTGHFRITLPGGGGGVSIIGSCAP